MCLTRAAAILGIGLVAGAFFMGTVAVHPAAAQLDAPAYMALRQALIRRLQRCLPPFMLVPLPASIGALWLCRPAVSWPLDTLAAALSLVTIGMTVAVNPPLNRRFARWSPEALPAD